MTIERAYRVAQNIDVPEAKRKFWPKWSVVMVRPNCEILDVVQFFEHPGETEQRACLQQYPKSASFTTIAGESFVSLEAFAKRVDEVAAIAKKLIK
jgi:hypothetical protein